MSDEQTDAANKFAREKGGKAVEVPDSGFQGRVVGNDTDGGDSEYEFIQLPGPGRPLGQFATEMGRICKERDIFRRETVPVTVNPETGQMEAVTPDRFRTLVEDFAVPCKSKYSKIKDDYIQLPETMTKDVAGGTLTADQFIYQLRQLNRVNHVRMPVMRRDGKIELLPDGYDEKSHIYTMPSEVEVRDIKHKEAVKIIDTILKEFPFGDFDDTGYSRSKAVAIAAMVSLYGANLQSMSARRLNFVFTANSQRSGKSLLAEIAIIATCGEAEVQTMSENKEELRKVLETEALASAPYIFFDNLEGNIKNQALDAFMTASVWAGRLMNSQKKFKAPKVSQVFMTGNNLSLSTDIANRSLLCDLYVSEADPQARSIKRVIDHSYLSRPDVRGDLLSAFWALIRHWDDDGRHRPERTIRGYEEWSAIFGGIVEASGWGDPLQRPHTDHSGDTEMRDMMGLIETLVLDMGANEEMEFDFAKLGETCVKNGHFEWMLDWTERAGEFPGERKIDLKPKSKSMLGRMWSGKYGGRIFVLQDGRRVQFGFRGINRSKRYRLRILPS